MSQQDIKRRRAVRLDAKIVAESAALEIEVATGLLSKIRFGLHHIPEYSTLFQLRFERYARKSPMWTWQFLKAFAHAMISNGLEIDTESGDMAAVEHGENPQ